MNRWVKDIKAVWNQLPKDVVLDSTVVFSKTLLDFTIKKDRSFQLVHLPGLRRMTTFSVNKDDATFEEHVKDAYFCVIKGLISLGKQKSIDIINQYADTKRLTILDDEYVETDEDQGAKYRRWLVELNTKARHIEFACGRVIDLKNDKLSYELPEAYDRPNNVYKYVITTEHELIGDNLYKWYRNQIYKSIKKNIFQILDTVLDLGYNPLGLLSYYLDKVNAKKFLTAPDASTLVDNNIFRIDMFEGDISSFKMTRTDFRGWLNEKTHG